MPNSTHLPKGRVECYCRDCAMPLSPSGQVLEENAVLLGAEQHPLLGEEAVALPSGQSLLMYA